MSQVDKVAECADAALKCVAKIAGASDRATAQKWSAKANEYASAAMEFARTARDKCTVIENYAQAAAEAVDAAEAAERAIISMTIQTN